MNFTINIDDDSLKQAVEKGILNIDSEKIAQIAEQAISQYLQNPNVLVEILFEKSYYGSYPNYNNPRQWFVNILKDGFSSEDFLKEKNEILKTIREHREQIVTRTIAEVFSRMLMTEDMKSELAVAFSNATRKC